MLKKYILVLAFLTISNTLFSQQFRQKVFLLKSSYITNVINLTPAEAEKFWPVYNLYTNKIHELKFELESSLNQQLLKKGSLETISEKEAAIYLSKMLETEQEIVTQKIKMNKELSKIISAKKMILLLKAEKDFNKRMLQEYGRRKGMKQ
jgi:hypothetical protein